jgi:hypothetical protein
MPRVAAYEHAADGRFNFSVDIGLPVFGRIVRYDGWLEPVRRSPVASADAEIGCVDHMSVLPTLVRDPQ